MIFMLNLVTLRHAATGQKYIYLLNINMFSNYNGRKYYLVSHILRHVIR